MDNSIELIPTQGNFTVNMAGTSLPVEADHAIKVRKVSLSYGPAKKPISVLNELSMEVCRGSIFGLLGPSGCGKTSLIRCILGVLKVDSGSVSVFGQAPGSPHSSVPGAGVGYMPQEITLYDDLTISETLCYFASLFGMSKSQIKERVNFLIQLLGLSDLEQLVNNLSGGQKRCVSLAASFIHKPPLLILDEPTVGVDPLLSRSIWDHLNKLVQADQLTVLFTTHYIEEAQGANRIGMMRDGEMLAQDSPVQLMERYKKPSLEAVFLHLCTRAEDVRNSVTLAEVVVEQENLSRRDSTSSAGSSGVDSMPESMEVPAAPAATPARPTPKAVSWSAHVSSMFLKNFISTSRSRLMMLFRFVLHTFIVISRHGDMYDPNPIPVAVYDGDNSTFSRQILETLNPDLISQKVFDSESDALAAVQNGLASTALTMCGNFSACLFERMKGQGTDIDAEALHNSTIHLYPDMTNQLMVLKVEEEVIQVFLCVGQQFLEEISANPVLLEMPVKMEEPVYGPPKPHYMTPGIILSIAFIFAIPLTILELVLEQRQGLLERTLVAGVSYLRIMISLLLPQVIIMFLSSLPYTLTTNIILNLILCNCIVITIRILFSDNFGRWHVVSLVLSIVGIAFASKIETFFNRGGNGGELLNATTTTMMPDSLFNSTTTMASNLTTVAPDVAEDGSHNQLIGTLFAVGAMVIGSMMCQAVRKLKSRQTILFNGALLAHLLLASIIFCGKLLGTCCRAYLVTILAVLSFYGQMLLTKAIQLEETGVVSVVRVSGEAFFAFVFQITIFGEVPDLYTILGAILVLFGSCRSARKCLLRHSVLQSTVPQATVQPSQSPQSVPTSVSSSFPSSIEVSEASTSESQANQFSLGPTTSTGFSGGEEKNKRTFDDDACDEPSTSSSLKKFKSAPMFSTTTTTAGQSDEEAEPDEEGESELREYEEEQYDEEDGLEVVNEDEEQSGEEHDVEEMEMVNEDDEEEESEGEENDDEEVDLEVMDEDEEEEESEREAEDDSSIEIIEIGDDEDDDEEEESEDEEEFF